MASVRSVCIEFAFLKILPCIEEVKILFGVVDDTFDFRKVYVS